MQNIGNVPIVQTDSATTAAAKLNRQYWRAEARFIRCFMYFELLKRYGGVPLLGDKIFTLNDDLQIPRNTFAQCVDYIVNECNIVKDSLRKEAIEEKIKAIYKKKGTERPQYQGDLPEGNNGLGLLLLGVTGDQVLPLVIYNEIKAKTLSKKANELYNTIPSNYSYPGIKSRIEAIAFG